MSLLGHRAGRISAVISAFLAIGVVGAAWAYFTSSGSATAHAGVGSLTAPGGLSVTAGAGTASLSWNAVTAPGSGPVTYYVTRNGGTPAGSCPASNAPAAVTSCSDTGLTAGQYTYVVTAVWRSWTAKSESQSVTLASGAATQIFVSGSTSDLASGSTRVLTATVEDASGHTVSTGTDSTASITFAKTTGAGTVTGLTTVAASNGVATDTVTGNLAGSIGLQASGTLNGFAVTSGTLSFTVAAGTASQIVLSGSTTELASATTRQLTATIEDAAGNTVTTGTDSAASISFGQTAGPGSVTGTGAVAASAGVATKTITGQTAGNVTLRASGTINGASTDSNTLSFNVVAGTATQIVLTGSSANLTSGTTRPFTATIKDGNGNTVTRGADSTASITFAKTAGTGTVTGLTTATASSGVASATLTGNTVGSVSLQASAALNGSSVSSNTVTFTVTFGPASQIALTGATTNLSSGAGRQLTATIEDAAGNTVTSGADSTASITVTKTTGTGTVTGLGSVAASAGVATDSVTGNTAGSITLQASGTLNGSSVTSGTLSFTVVAGTASQIVLSGSTANLGGGGTRTLTATIEDAAGNTVTTGADSTASITFAKTSGTGTVTGLGSVAASAGVATDTVTGNGAGSISLRASGTLNSTARTSNTLTFAVTAAPTVTSVSPSAKPQGASNQTLTISGTNFVSGATVSFSGAGITVGGVTFVSATQLTATVSVSSSAVTGARDITVTNPDGGTGTKTGAFTVNAAPTVSSTSPSVADQGASNYNVTINGAGFVSGAGVSFSGSGITVGNVTFNSATSLTARISILSTATQGSRDVTVTNPDGGIGTATAAFTVGATPAITFPTSSNPETTTHGSTGVQFTIIGAGFEPGATVNISGPAFTVTNTQVVDSSHINVTVSTSATKTGTFNLTVTNPDGTQVTSSNSMINQ